MILDTWRMGQQVPYLSPAACKKSGFLAISEKAINIDPRETMSRILYVARERGMQIPDPSFADKIHPHDLEDTFKALSLDGYDFVFCATDDNLNCHGLFSYLLIY